MAVKSGDKKHVFRVQYGKHINLYIVTIGEREFSTLGASFAMGKPYELVELEWAPYNRIEKTDRFLVPGVWK